MDDQGAPLDTDRVGGNEPVGPSERCLAELAGLRAEVEAALASSSTWREEMHGQEQEFESRLRSKLAECMDGMEHVSDNGGAGPLTTYKARGAERATSSANAVLARLRELEESLRAPAPAAAELSQQERLLMSAATTMRFPAPDAGPRPESTVQGLDSQMWALEKELEEELSGEAKLEGQVHDLGEFSRRVDDLLGRLDALR